jgi:predicted alpha/beta-fold hydrolase
MPIIKNNNFNPKLPFKNKHFNTLYRYFKTKYQINFNRIRISTNDLDFLDLDFSTVGSKRLIITIHGLEGSSNSSYVLSLCHYFNQKDIDVLALNLRSCSGELNKKLESYHSGKTEDLHQTIQFVKQNYQYDSIYLVGYSLGGNIVLKYMGEYAKRTPSILKCAVGISVPCDLEGSANAIAKKENYFYNRNFLKTLKIKSLKKLKTHKNHQLDKNKIAKVTNFKDFDDAFTAPSNGYKDAEEYWLKNSSLFFIPKINKPSLLITALDDPFLSASCYPFKIADNSDKFYILATKFGGHVGYCETYNMSKNLWLEKQIENFLMQY